jgi:hypothetical protein
VLVRRANHAELEFVDVHGACLYLHVPCTCLLVAACILYIPVCMPTRAAGKFVPSAKLLDYLFTGIYLRGLRWWLGGTHLAVVLPLPWLPHFANTKLSST